MVLHLRSGVAGPSAGARGCSPALFPLLYARPRAIDALERSSPGSGNATRSETHGIFSRMPDRNTAATTLDFAICPARRDLKRAGLAVFKDRKSARRGLRKWPLYCPNAFFG